MSQNTATKAAKAQAQAVKKARKEAAVSFSKVNNHFGCVLNLHQENPSVALPENSPGQRYFLGYTICNVVLANLGGDGPLLVPGPLHRPHSQVATNRLLSIAGENGKGLRRLHPPDALCFTVDPGLLDPACLLLGTPGQVFKPAIWRENASSKQVLLVAGQHRIAALAHQLKPSMDQLKKLEEKIERKKKVPRALLQQKLDLVLKIQNHDFWLVGFYSSQCFNPGHYLCSNDFDRQAL